MFLKVFQKPKGASTKDITKFYWFVLNCSLHIALQRFCFIRDQWYRVIFAALLWSALHGPLATTPRRALAGLTPELPCKIS